MKKIVLSILIALSVVMVKAQVIFGKPSSSAIVAFKDNTKSGLVLPKLTFDGMFFRKGKAGSVFYYCFTKEVSFYDGTSVFSLSSTSNTLPKECNDLKKFQDVGKGVAVGDKVSSSKVNKVIDQEEEGVMVIKSDTEALLLPKVPDAHLNIKSPAAGTIVYDPKNKVVSVYNGSTWSFLTNSPPSS